MDNRIGVTYKEDQNTTVSQSRTASEAGASTEAFLGGAAVVLGILGLVGLASTSLDAIAAIALGVSLLMFGRFVSRHTSVINTDSHEARKAWQAVKSSSAMAAIAGLGGIVLGILALIGISPMALLGVATIVLGAGLIMAGGARSGVESMHNFMAAGEGRTVRDVVYAASGSDVLIGGGAVVLGILALVGLAPLVLTLVAMLSMGASVMLTGSASAAEAFQHFG